MYLHNVRLKTEIIQLLFSAHFLVLVLADKIFNSHLSTQHSNNQKTVKLLAPTETEFQWHEVSFSPFPYDVLSSLAPDLTWNEKKASLQHALFLKHQKGNYKLNWHRYIYWSAYCVCLLLKIQIRLSSVPKQDGSPRLRWNYIFFHVDINQNAVSTPMSVLSKK